MSPSSPSRSCAPATRGARWSAWITLNLALDRRRPPSQSADLAFARLKRAFARWRREGLLRSAWFVRKPPDVRLRLESGDVGALRAAAAPILDEAVRDGELASWFPTPYEPEEVQLGGEAAVEAVHRWFDADTRAWLVRDPTSLTLPVLADLFRRGTGDRFEAWDAWCNLARLHEGAGWVTALREQPEPVAVPTPSRRDRVVLRHYQRANEALARDLDQIGRRGELLYGPRGILPFVALFHWNRLGLAPDVRRRTYRAMIAALDPKAGLAGTAP